MRSRTPGALFISVLAAAALLAAGCGGDDDDAPADAGGDDAGPVDDGGADAGTDAGPEELEPDGYCPGGPGCPDEGDDVLHVGAAMRTTTPTIDENTDVLTVDVDGDAEYDPAEDEFADNNDNGTFDGEWIAGFGNPRPASGVHDDTWVRVIALRQNETTIVLGAIDCIGYFRDEIVMIREMVSDLDVDYVMFAATHVHQARDTLGIWGLNETSSGIDPEHMEHIRTQAAAAIREAVGALEPARIQYASLRLQDAPGGVNRYHGDQRDPIIVDDEVRILRFEATADESTIATLVNWGSHPEYMWDDNDMISSDFPHWLREGIEDGAMGPDGAMADGLGGMAVFFPGALGGQIGPNRIEPAEWDGTPVENRTPDAARVVGEQLAWIVLDALGPDGGSVTEETADLGYRNRSFMVDVQNRGYHIAFLNELFKRQGYNWDGDLPVIPGENEPDILTEVSVVDIGRAQLIGMPGELLPELFVGGYDGSWTPAGIDILTEGNENPPDLEMAPEGPYLKDLARDDADYVFLMGLGNDMLGYLIPSYDYEVSRRNPYIDQAPGDHYEETNSVGVDGWPTIERELEELLAWTPP